MIKTDEFSYKNFTLWHINMKKRGKNGKKYSTCVYSVYTWICHISSVRFIPFPVFRFLFKVTKNEKNQLSYLFIFCLKNSHFAWRWQLIFFGHFDKKTKNEKWNELDISPEVTKNEVEIKPIKALINIFFRGHIEEW